MKNRHLKPKNWNEHVVKYLIIALGLALFVTAILTACTKKSSFTSQTLEKVSCDFGLPHSHYAAAKRRPPKGKPTTDTTKPQDPPQYSGNVLYLDFDGEVVSGTSWNVYGPINALPSGLTASEVDTVIARTKAEYEPMGFTVTTDRRVFDAAPYGHRQQVIVTETWEWYGQAGGVAYIGTYSGLTAQPCFVFSSLLNYSGKWVADAAIHEAGHTLKLRHVPQPDGSSPYATYGNYMGAAYYVPRGFFERLVKDQFGYVDQIETIASNL